MKKYILLCGLIICVTACDQGKSTKSTNLEKSADNESVYKGTASVTQGFTESNVEKIYECIDGRPTNTGVIESKDGKQWTVPASNNFTNENFPFASDLHNSCNGNTYSDVTQAISQLDGSDIIEIDKDGNLFTAYIFADNYFEMYVNGIPVGKDKVPFTKFNSSTIRFKVKRPFTIAMKLVDWEEALGIGTEKNHSSDYHAGDGGMVAVIKDMDDNTIATTNENWKAQTFYTSPIKDLSCVSESGLMRISKNCDETDSDDGISFYGLHWEIPSGWEKADFDDSSWPNATSFTNETIGVDNKKAYTNFTNIFDDHIFDAKFIWSTNVVLDNEVIVRYTVK